jgi:hypothetical protein
MAVALTATHYVAGAPPSCRRPTIGCMTMIVAWRDPFCLVADSRESGAFERRSSVGWKKIVHLSEELVLGLAGPSTALPEIEKGVLGALPTAGSWADFEYATQDIVGTVNDRTYSLKQSLKEMVTIVVAGTIGGQAGLFDMGPFAVGREPRETAETQQFAFAGSGGMCANAARAIASMWRPEIVREDLLRTSVEAAVKMDPGQTGKPIWRVDLGVGAMKSVYEWLPAEDKGTPLLTH